MWERERQRRGREKRDYSNTGRRGKTDYKQTTSINRVYKIMASKKAKKLVVDTNAFIKAVRIETIGQEFFTIPQVHVLQIVLFSFIALLLF